MAKDYEEEEYLKGFKRDDLDDIRESYLEAYVGDEINTMPFDELNKINGKIFKEVKKIYSKYYKDLRKEKGLSRSDEINMNLWDQAVGKYEDHKKAVKKFWAGLGLGALVAASAITAKTALPAGQPEKIETQDKRTDEEKGKNVVNEKGEVNQKSEEAKNFENEMKKQAQVKEDEPKKKRETREQRLAREEKEKDSKDSNEFYTALINEYNQKYQGTQQEITKRDTIIVEHEEPRQYIYYGVRNDGEIMYVDDLSKNVEQAASLNLQYNEEGAKPHDYTYVLDNKNDKIIATTAVLNGETIDVVSNYYQTGSNRIFTNPAGDDINKALTVTNVLNKNPQVLESTTEKTAIDSDEKEETRLDKTSKAFKTIKDELNGVIDKGEEEEER